LIFHFYKKPSHLSYSAIAIGIAKIPVVGIPVPVPVEVSTGKQLVANLSSFHQSFSQVAFVFHDLK